MDEERKAPSSGAARRGLAERGKHGAVLCLRAGKQGAGKGNREQWR
ncbi:hypothetical protein ACFORO_38245 [Amycolatopsis halotolerans]|uniref:Uncharacterized protein n=1 Tax=Amycolatopsis halotolerans TaxID=330083 RepID=A0ABV7QUV1_9PSEU